VRGRWVHDGDNQASVDTFGNLPFTIRDAAIALPAPPASAGLSTDITASWAYVDYDTRLNSDETIHGSVRRCNIAGKVPKVPATADRLRFEGKIRSKRVVSPHALTVSLGSCPHASHASPSSA
jgi:hypothetical protein